MSLPLFQMTFVLLNCIRTCSYSAAAKYWNPSLMIILCISLRIIGSEFVSVNLPIPENPVLFLLIIVDILNRYTPHSFFLFYYSYNSVLFNKHSFHLLKDTRWNWFLFNFAGSKMPSSLKCQIADCKSKCCICC